MNQANETLTDAELDQAIAERPFPKVTKESIEARIKAASYQRVPGTTLTFCILHMENGFTVTGKSACVDTRNFNEEIGRNIAYRNAFEKLWELEGYLLAERMFEAGSVSHVEGIPEAATA
jgi:hypothetical protein